MGEQLAPLQDARVIGDARYLGLARADQRGIGQSGEQGGQQHRQDIKAPTVARILARPGTRTPSCRSRKQVTLRMRSSGALRALRMGRVPLTRVRHEIVIYVWALVQRRPDASLKHHNRMVHPLTR